MNAPRGGWYPSTLATVRAFGEGLLGPSDVLAALRAEDLRGGGGALPAALRADFEAAFVAVHRVARTALMMVRARDEAIFGDIADTQPPAANEIEPCASEHHRHFSPEERRLCAVTTEANRTPSVFDVNIAATEAGARNVATSRLAPTSFRVDCTHLTGEQRESLRLLLTERFNGAQFCVEERCDR